MFQSHAISIPAHQTGIFWEVSSCQPQYSSLLSCHNEEMGSYSTNSCDSYSPPLFHISHTVPSPLMHRTIFHNCILHCFQQCSAKTIAVADSPFTSSANNMKCRRMERFYVSTVSQDTQDFTLEEGITFWKAFISVLLNKNSFSWRNTVTKFP